MFDLTLYLAVVEISHLPTGTAKVTTKDFSASLSWRNSKCTLQHHQSFVISSSYVATTRNPSNTTAQTAVNKFAKLLANRFNSKVGCTESWDTTRPGFRVIIDNMMNLEVGSISVSARSSNSLAVASLHLIGIDRKRYLQDYRDQPCKQDHGESPSRR